MSEKELLDQIDRYLNGEMTKEERARFESLRIEDAAVNEKVVEHKHFVGLIKQYGERLELERRLDAIHEEIDVHTLEDELMIHPSGIVRLWRNHHSKISVAASIAIFAVLCTLFFTGYLANREINYLEVGRIQRLEKSQKALSNKVNQLDGNKSVRTNPGIKGTGFAISSNGYIVTDYHVVNGADSVYVQSYDGKSYKARVINLAADPDVAILQITDPSFKALPPIPYNFKKAESDIGENVFTVGYPIDAMVLGMGYLSAGSGYQGDSTSYQISVPVNPGNSGGPLLDNKGNVIGIVDAKQTNMAGTAFALKSSYLMKAIENIPSDSLNKPINLNNKNVLATLNRVQQIKKLQNYIFMIRVYNQ